MLSRGLRKAIAIGAATAVLGSGAVGAIAAANSGASGSGAATSGSTTTALDARSSGAASNARSGPAAGGSIGTVSGASASGFTLVTSAGEKVTVKETAATTYETGATAAAAGAVTNGKTALVLGTTDSTTITAAQIIVQSPSTLSSTSSQVVPFTRGAPSTSKSVGQVPANYRQGSGTIVSGSAAAKATEAALAAYPGGTVDRVVQLSNAEYEVHNIGVNWPHHIFVNQNYEVIGAN